MFTSEDLNNMPEPEILFTGDAPLTEVRFEGKEVEKKLRNLKSSGAPWPDKL